MCPRHCTVEVHNMCVRVCARVLHTHSGLRARNAALLMMNVYLIRACRPGLCDRLLSPSEAPPRHTRYTMAASLSKEETIRQNERIAIDKIAKAQAEHQKGKFATSSGMTVEGERTATHASASQDKSVLHAGYLIKAPPIKGKVSIKYVVGCLGNRNNMYTLFLTHARPLYTIHTAPSHVPSIGTRVLLPPGAGNHGTLCFARNLSCFSTMAARRALRKGNHPRVLLTWLCAIAPSPEPAPAERTISRSKWAKNMPTSLRCQALSVCTISLRRRSKMP